LSQYAGRRGLRFESESAVPPLTPLLVKGTRRTFSPALRGRIADGLEGTLAEYHYVRVRRHAQDEFDFTLTITRVPESTVFVPRLICERRDRKTDTVHHAFGLHGERLWQESEALDQRYTLTIGPHQDENWMRQLFSPTFIDWLATEPPATFSFELVYGVLCCSIEETALAEPDLDRLRDCAAHVTSRIAQECAE
jgi:hypothetical protein